MVRLRTFKIGSTSFMLKPDALVFDMKDQAEQRCGGRNHKPINNLFGIRVGVFKEEIPLVMF